ncbi:MAG: hypothetical protein H7301_13590 [Cryobacterium sp.]|nr:hypothetical protein [Oligoflexia bacterium]
MKNLFAFALLFLQLSAGAASAAQTKYLNTWSNGRQKTESVMVFEPATSSKKINSTATISVFGQTNRIASVLDQEWKTESELRALYIDTCVAEGGTFESITVKAGTFNACKKHYLTPDVEMTKWLGEVPPLGTIRMDFKKDEVQTREELIEFVP